MLLFEWLIFLNGKSKGELQIEKTVCLAVGSNRFIGFLFDAYMNTVSYIFDYKKKSKLGRSLRNDKNNGDSIPYSTAQESRQSVLQNSLEPH